MHIASRRHCYSTETLLLKDRREPIALAPCGCRCYCYKQRGYKILQDAVNLPPVSFFSAASPAPDSCLPGSCSAPAAWCEHGTFSQCPLSFFLYHPLVWSLRSHVFVSSLVGYRIRVSSSCYRTRSKIASRVRKMVGLSRKVCRGAAPSNSPGPPSNGLPPPEPSWPP